MPGFKGKIKIELEMRERTLERDKLTEATEPFVKPLPQLEGKSSSEGHRSASIDRFLAIGDAKAEAPAPSEPRIPSQPRSAPGIWERLRAYLAALPAGFGGPFMIFSFLLFPGRDFPRNIAALNEKLRDFDEAMELRQNGSPLSTAQQKLLQNGNMQDLHRHRAELIQEYQSLLRQSQNHPQVRMRQEIKRLFNEATIRQPEDALRHLAAFFGTTEDIYMGALLKHSSRSTLEAWVQRHQTDILGDGEATAFKTYFMEWVGLHDIRNGIPRLKEYLVDPDPQIRILAGRTLMKFGETRRVLPTLIKIALKAQSSAARLEAVEALKDFGPGEATSGLLAVAKDVHNSPELRVDAIEILAEWGETGALHETHELFDEWSRRAEAMEASDNIWEVYNLMRCAQALRRLGQAVEIDGRFQEFLQNFHPDPTLLLNSKLLQETVSLYAAVEGRNAQQGLLKLALDASARPEFRFGAIVALDGETLRQNSERLFTLLRERKEPEGVRLAILEALIKTGQYSAVLPLWATDLAQSKSLFVRLGAIDALIDLGETAKAQVLAWATQQVSRKVLDQMGISAMEDGLPFAYHEYHAVFEVDAWFIKAASRIDPGWEKRLSEVNYETVMKMIHEEMKQRETLSISFEGEEWLRPDFDWEAVKGAQQNSLFLIGVTLSKGILSLANPDTVPMVQKLGLLSGIRKDAIDAIAHAARTELRGVAALLQLHYAQNPHALPALLNLDIRTYLRASLTDPSAMQVLSELAAVGHRAAKAAYRKGSN